MPAHTDSKHVQVIRDPSVSVHINAVHVVSPLRLPSAHAIPRVRAVLKAFGAVGVSNDTSHALMLIVPSENAPNASVVLYGAPN